MASLLPSGDLGMKSLPSPSSLSVAPQGLGDREVLTSSPSIKDGLEPIIMSLDLLNESVDSIVSSVSDADRLTVADLDKLFQKYFSKQALADSTSLALTRQSPPAIESSLMVRQQVKANDVIKKQSDKFEDVFLKQSSSSSKSNKSGGFEAGYNKVMDTAYTATHNPLALVDKFIPFLGSLLSKGKDSEKSTEKKKEKESFYGQGDVEEGAFYGSFGQQASVAVGSSVADEGFYGSGSPLGTAADPLYILDAGVTETSSVSDIYEEAAEAGVKADNALTDTLNNPEQSNFANFVGGGGGGDDGGNGKNKAKKDGGSPGIGVVLIAGMILAALIVFKDVIEKVFDKVIIPFGELLIDFLTALKEPLIAFISAFLDVAIVVLGVIKDILVAIAPYLVLMAVAICGLVVVVLNIIKDILVAIAPYLVLMAVAISGIIVTVLTIISNVLKALEPPLVAIIKILGDIGVAIVGAILDLVKIITFPLRLISDILETVRPHIIRMADFIGGVIADWFEDNEDAITDLVASIVELADTIVEKLNDFTEGIDATKIGEAFGNTLKSALDALSTALNALNAFLNSNLVQGLTSFVDNTVGSLLVTLGDSAGDAGSWLSETWVGRLFRADSASREDRAQNTAERAVGTYSNILSDVYSALSRGESGSSDPVVKLLHGIYADTSVIAHILVAANQGAARIASFVQEADDLIISSDGHVYETAPNDSILAIQNGRVSMSSANPVSSMSPSSLASQETPQGSPSSVTNVYNQASLLDSVGVSPFSEFCPVGVG